MQNTKDSFFSMDRLVEFGMGMAMSQQIAQTMNAMMTSMKQPPQVQVAAQPLYMQQPIQQGTPTQPVYRQYAFKVALISRLIEKLEGFDGEVTMGMMKELKPVDVARLSDALTQLEEGDEGEE